MALRTHQLQQTEAASTIPVPCTQQQAALTAAGHSRARHGGQSPGACSDLNSPKGRKLLLPLPWPHPGQGRTRVCTHSTGSTPLCQCPLHRELLQHR